VSYPPTKHPARPGELTDGHTFRGRALLLDGGSVDPEKNVALSNVVKKARADGVPKANIESALQKVRACVISFFLLVPSLSGGPHRGVSRSLFMTRESADMAHLLGRGREGRVGTADNLRGACSRLCRTYHVRACPASFFSPCATRCAADSRKRMLDG
jgi:hypothetical protein